VILDGHLLPLWTVLYDMDITYTRLREIADIVVETRRGGNHRPKSHHHGSYLGSRGISKLATLRVSPLFPGLPLFSMGLT